jgi:drug/metabolite transporter (DMT)-like permease
VSSACIMFQTWALEKKGPVMVSMFSPTQTVGSAIFSALFLGRVLHPGRYYYSLYTSIHIHDLLAVFGHDHIIKFHTCCLRQ